MEVVFGEKQKEQQNSKNKDFCWCGKTSEGKKNFTIEVEMYMF